VTPDVTAGLSNTELVAALRAAGVEARVGSVDTNKGAHQLMDYWVHGEGAAKIRWGEPNDWYRCVAHLGKYVRDPKGLCTIYHHHALGVWPGQEDAH
jgi:hypothetical protein